MAKKPTVIIDPNQCLRCGFVGLFESQHIQRYPGEPHVNHTRDFMGVALKEEDREHERATFTCPNSACRAPQTRMWPTRLLNLKEANVKAMATMAERARAQQARADQVRSAAKPQPVSRPAYHPPAWDEPEEDD